MRKWICALCLTAAFSLVGLTIAVPSSSPARESEPTISLELRAEARRVKVGDTFNITLYAMSDDHKDQSLGALDILIKWNPKEVRLLGVDNEGAPDWELSEFMFDPWRINEEIPPQDGDGLYTGWSKVNVPVIATPDGALMTTFQFEALSRSRPAEIRFLARIRRPPMPVIRTKVYDWWVPNKNVTGTLGPPAEIMIRPVKP